VGKIPLREKKKVIMNERGKSSPIGTASGLHRGRATCGHCRRPRRASTSNFRSRPLVRIAVGGRVTAARGESHNPTSNDDSRGRDLVRSHRSRSLPETKEGSETLRGLVERDGAEPMKNASSATCLRVGWSYYSVRAETSPRARTRTVRETVQGAG